MRDEDEDAPSIQKTRPTPIVRGSRRGRQGPGSTPDSAFEPAARKSPSASFTSLGNARGFKSKKQMTLNERLAPSRFDTPERAEAKRKEALKLKIPQAKRPNFGGTKSGGLAQQIYNADRGRKLGEDKVEMARKVARNDPSANRYLRPKY